MLNHLKTDAIEVSANNLMKIHEEGKQTTFNSWKHIVRKGHGLCGYEALDSRAVPTPKLLIKDHNQWIVKVNT